MLLSGIRLFKENFGGIMEELIAYIKLHLISLEQDLESADTMVGIDYLAGQIKATEHLLSVAHDILAKSNERK
jgi:hypothetical protein